MSSCVQRLALDEDRPAAGDRSAASQGADVDIDFDMIHNVIAQVNGCLPTSHHLTVVGPCRW